MAICVLATTTADLDESVVFSAPPDCESGETSDCDGRLSSSPDGARTRNLNRVLFWDPVKCAGGTTKKHSPAEDWKPDDDVSRFGAHGESRVLERRPM